MATLLLQASFDFREALDPVLAVVMQFRAIFAVRDGLCRQSLAVFSHGDLAFEALGQMTHRPLTQKPNVHDWEAQPAFRTRPRPLMQGQVRDHDLFGADSDGVELGAIFTWMSVPKMIGSPLAEGVERRRPDILVTRATGPQHVAFRRVGILLVA